MKEDNAALVIQIVIICKEKRSHHSKTSVSRLKEVTLPFSRALFERILMFHQEVTGLSCDSKTVYLSYNQYMYR